MKQENKLRTALRDFYDNQEVPFDENEWERASASLIAARRKRKVRFALFSVLVLFFAVFITFYNLPSFKKYDWQQASSPLDPKLKSGPVALSTEQNEAKALKPKTFKSNHAHSLNMPIVTTQKEKQNSKVPTSEKNGQVFEANLPISDSDLNEQENNTPQTIAIAENYQLKGVSTMATTIDTNENTTNKPKAFVDSEENEENVTTAVENLTTAQNQFPAKEISPRPIDATLQNIVPLVLSESNKEAIIINNSGDTHLKDSTHSTVIDTSLQSIINSTPDTMESIVEEKSTDTLINGYLMGEGVFYEAGSAFYYGWKNSQNIEARGFSPVVGINYMNKLSKHTSFSFGVQYLNVPKLSNSSKTSRVSTYQYGEQSEVTVVTPRTIHYLLAPLRFHYFFDQKNSVGAGFNVAYLLNVDASVTTYEERSGYTGNYETVTLSGYTEGFSWYDSQLTLFYTRKIRKSFGFQAEIFLGLIDVKQDEFFGLNYKERNSGLKLTFIYYAFRKNGK